MEVTKVSFEIASYSLTGTYLDDVWRFNLSTLEFTKLKTIGVDAPLLARSNHTVVYHEPTQAVYIFGGGQAHKLRFNDTLKLTFPTWKPNEVFVERMRLKDDSPLPQPRTYHASCLVGRFMVVIGGESNNTDMQDLWVLDVEDGRWYQLSISNQESFKSKRFLSVSAVSGNRIITFGGCHSEYEHVNDLDMFDLTAFIESGCSNLTVMCTKLAMTGKGPSSRWGHSSAVYRDKMYILGGRNSADISELHCFDVDTLTWTELRLKEP